MSLSERERLAKDKQRQTQPITEGKGTSGKAAQHQQKPRKGATQPNPPNPQSQLIVFYGFLNGVLEHSFQALVGAQPPTITGGGAKIQTIDRPRSLGYTMPTGYDPISMDVQIRFENWVSYATPINGDVEGDISKLMWMSGRGKLGPGRAASGNPPVVMVRAFDTGTTDIPMIPPDVQGLEWVISGITWDTAPLRLDPRMIKSRGLSLPVGTRARQDATVALTQWIPPPGFRTKTKKPAKGVFSHYSDSRYDSVRKMTNRYCDRHTQADYQLVLALKSNKKLPRNPGAHLPSHTRVYFPDSLKAQH